MSNNSAPNSTNNPLNQAAYEYTDARFNLHDTDFSLIEAENSSTTVIYHNPTDGVVSATVKRVPLDSPPSRHDMSNPRNWSPAERIRRIRFDTGIITLPTGHHLRYTGPKGFYLLCDPCYTVKSKFKFAKIQRKSSSLSRTCMECSLKR